IRGKGVELLQHLDGGPVGDPVPVRETAAADDWGLHFRDRLRLEPGLAHARLPGDRHQLATFVGPRPAPRLADDLQLRCAADKRALMRALALARDGEKPLALKGK